MRALRPKDLTIGIATALEAPVLKPVAKAGIAFASPIVIRIAGPTLCCHTLASSIGHAMLVGSTLDTAGAVPVRYAHRGFLLAPLT